MRKIIWAVLLIFLDSLTKFFAVGYLKDKESINLYLIKLTYVENRGAAFGILQGQKFFFIIITFCVLIAIIYYYEKVDTLSKLSLIFIFSGTVGNFIGRLFFGYVVDFIELSFIDFPVFNLADIFLTIGTVILGFVTLKIKIMY